MSTDFTPGPWVARPDENSSCEWEVVKTDARATSISQDPWFICLCMDDADGASAEDNARLIAAAPDMHAVCIAVDELFRDLTGKVNEAFLDRFAQVHFAARAALAKVRGEQ